MPQIRCSRESETYIDTDGKPVKVDDFVDYQNHIYFLNDKQADEYNESRKKSLLALMQSVLENELTDKQKQAVLLVRGMQLKQQQAGEIMGIERSTVCRHLKYAQKKFDRALKHFELNQTHRAE